MNTRFHLFPKPRAIVGLALVLGCGLFASFTGHSDDSDVKLKFVRADSEETAGENGAAQNAVDGDPNTIWHTQWQDSNPEPPHEIVLELVPPSVIKGFTYLPRQDDSDHGLIKDFEFYVSDDGANFGQPVKTGTFESDREKKTESFAPVKCRFIKLRALSEINGQPWTSAAEISVIPADGYAAAGDPSITVALAIPEHSGLRAVERGDRDAHFHVIISNNSPVPRRIWREWCSWGWSGLSFEFTSRGETWTATKMARNWTRNFPDWWTLAPHESVVLDVNFADASTWQGFPPPTTAAQTVTMRAVLEFKPDDKARQNGIWTGRVASQSEEITFSPGKPDVK